VCVCVCACVRACVRVRACACVCVGVFVCLLPVILADLFGVERLSDSFGAIMLCEGLGTTVGVPIAGKSCVNWHYHSFAKKTKTIYSFKKFSCVAFLVTFGRILLHVSRNGYL